MLPPAGSRGDQGMLRAFNAKTRAARKLAGTPAEPVADGVWRVRGGVPRAMNVYLIEDDGGGVTVFDAGVKSMASAVTAAGAAALGGINRVVLSHAHIDHRGTAGALGAPVLCHPPTGPTPRATAGSTTSHLERLAPHARLVYPALLRMWDGGPVRSPARSRRATTSAASASCTCPGTRRARSRSSASATASR